jgi:hypothetical protein
MTTNVLVDTKVTLHSSIYDVVNPWVFISDPTVNNTRNDIHTDIMVSVEFRTAQEIIGVFKNKYSFFDAGSIEDDVRFWAANTRSEMGLPEHVVDSANRQIKLAMSRIKRLGDHSLIG